MKLATKRLVIRLVNIKDVERISKIGNDKEINYFTYFYPYPFTVTKAKKIIKSLEKEIKKGETYMWVLTLKEDGTIIGMMDLFDVDRKEGKAKIGYWVGREYWGQGYATEAVSAALNFGFQKLKMRKISADCLTDNAGSIRLLEKMGFRKIGVVKKEKKVHGKYRDQFLWELLKGDLR